MTSAHRLVIAAIGIAIAAAIYQPATPARSSPTPAPCGGNLVVNGSFEEGPAPGSYTTLQSGSTAIAGWSVTKGSVDIVGSLWKASDGDRSVDLDGVTFGGISQTIDTKPGTTYVVTFDLAGNPYGQPTVKRLQIAAAGQSAQFEYDLANKPRLSMGWKTQTWRFAAKTDSTTLGFDSLDTVNGYFGPVIDNVRVQTACK